MKKLYTVLAFLAVSILLSGCAPQEGGVFYTSLVEPFIYLIKFFASFFNNSYGIGIIIVTVCVRLIVMPFMLRSFKGQKKMQFKMKKIKPQMDEINKKMKSAKDEKERAQYSQEMMALYKEHGINPLGMGCLPMIIQMPILMALYFAISHNDALSSHSFAWFNLGTPNIFMALIAGALYLLQAYLSTKYLPGESNGQMKYIMYISPIMIFIVSMSTPAALPLYWSASAIVLIVQQYISNKYFNYHEDDLQTSS
ncbi:membrane protein insertase YidC [Mammaliicoccus sciuri]|uniref:membrane protein insertase YidC n=1 Tax=Mammaliicoccus sciuri TaxID=1296 RepID=UPI00226DAEEA|nr:membrane protein insertase YidC [Mammaliicoccus sciuri]MCY1028394.1 membrane protein insertase YidC [Mammaliicoccus sciuri]